MRKWIVDRIRLDPVITSALGNGDLAAGQAKVMSAGAPGLPGQPETRPPFVIVRALPALPGLTVTPKVQILPYLVWVHDQQGSFESVIGTVLTRLQIVLPTDLPVRLPTGEVIINCAWESDSGDQLDQGFGTATRYGQYRLVVKKP